MRLNLACVAVSVCLAARLVAQLPEHRPPPVPLAANDPYFSLWSMGDKLNGVAVKHWSEAVQPMTGLARIDGRNYRWMGMDPRRGETAPNVAMEQKSVEVTPLHSRYRFTAGGVEIKVTFFTAAFPGDL